MPDLGPGEQAVRYVKVPHVLKAGDADAFKVILVWPAHVDITGTYSISPRLVTDVGVTELESFDVPVLSDRVPMEDFDAYLNDPSDEAGAISGDDVPDPLVPVPTDEP